MKNRPTLENTPLPANTDAEADLLATCFIDRRDAETIADRCRPEYFTTDRNRRFFEAILRLIDAGKPIDATLVHAELRAACKTDMEGDAAYLGRLLTETPIAGNIEHHVGLIRDVYLRRRIIKAANDAITTSLMPNRDLEGIFRKWQNDAFDLYTADNARDRVKSFPELVDAAGEQLEAAQQRGIKPGIQTDLYELDRVLTGLQPSNLYILAARPSMGKTALAMRITVNIAVSGNPVAFMSLEMSKESLTLRALCAVGGIAFDRAFNGCLNDDEWIQFVEAQSKIHQSQIFIDDSPALHYQDIARRLRRLKRLHGIKLAIIDYLQLAQGDKSNGRVIEVTSISAGLVAIAKELNIPILALSQLSRACESRNNKRPQLSDLRDSGAIEQDAYAVIALYNDGLSNETEAIVLKNRNGKTGTVLLGWDGPSMNFYNCLKGKNAA